MKNMRTNKIESSRGFTLVEILVAMTVGILILIALSAVMINNTSSRRSGDRNATLQTNARYAVDLLRRDLQHAGYAGSTGFTPNTEFNPENFKGLVAPPAIDNACSGSAGRLEWPLEASDNGNNFPCIPANEYVAGTDVLLVRHAAQQSVWVPNGTHTVDQRTDKTLYYYSHYLAEESAYGVGKTLPTKKSLSKPLNLEAVFPVQENIYYIRPWSFDSNENPRIPALVTRSLGVDADGPAMGGAELVAAGVADMQLSFGISDDRAGAKPNFHLTKWKPEVLDATKKLNIANGLESVRVSFLMQGLTQEPSYVNSNTYVVGDKAGVVAPGDGYRRSVVSTTVQVRR